MTGTSQGLAPRTLTLPDRADPGAEGPLLAFLRAGIDRDAEVSLAQARRLDPRVIETLVVAARDWHLRGLRVAVTEVPHETEERLTRLGLTPEVLPRGASGATGGAAGGAAGRGVPA